MRIIIAQELTVCQKAPKGYKQLPTQTILDLKKKKKWKKSKKLTDAKFPLR